MMPLLPIPPTDNFYKFTAIGGLILAGLSLYFPQQQLAQHTLSTIEVSAELEKVTKDGQVLEEHAEGLRIVAKSLVDMMDKIEKWEITQLKKSPHLSDRAANDRDMMIRFLTERLNRLESDMKTFSEKRTENHHLLKQFTSEMEKLTYLKPQLDKLFWTSVGTFSLGVIMMIFGFWNWYFKFQIYQDRIVKAQAEQWTSPKSEIDRDEIPG